MRFVGHVGYWTGYFGILFPLLLLWAGCESSSETRWLRQSPFKVEITGTNYVWLVRYPGKDCQFNTADDLLTPKKLQVPANSQVELILHSDDYAYVFAIPELKLKEMAVPGLTFKLSFQTGENGSYELLGDDLCGLPHPDFLGTMTIEPIPELARNLKQPGK